MQKDRDEIVLHLALKICKYASLTLGRVDLCGLKIVQPRGDLIAARGCILVGSVTALALL